MKKDFNKIALQSSLFKGHSAWYFPYLKSERLAHVLLLLGQRMPVPTPLFLETLSESVRIPGALLRVMTGELTERELLARLFSLLSSLRLLGTQGEIGKENISVLLQEYESIIERLADKGQVSGLAITQDHLAVTISAEDMYDSFLPMPLDLPKQNIKDNYKGHIKDQNKSPNLRLKDQETGGDRMLKILEIIKKNDGISIKGISAIIRDCSEKTIQRELGTLIERGLVIREGERRWSIYKVSSVA